MPPVTRCPLCGEVAPPREWEGDHAAGRISFRQRCPHCGRWSDIADLELVLTHDVDDDPPAGGPPRGP